MKKTYISGPMSGWPNDNFDMFNMVARRLRFKGWKVENPAEHFDGQQGLPRWQYLAHDVQVLIDDCDAIVLLPGWEESEGARIEAQIALDRGYVFYRWDSWYYDAIPWPEFSRVEDVHA